MEPRTQRELARELLKKEGKSPASIAMAPPAQREQPKRRMIIGALLLLVVGVWGAVWLGRVLWRSGGQEAAPARGVEERALVRHRAGAPVESGARLALVIGNSTYPNGPLRNPRNDAAAMARALRELGFTVLDGSDLGYGRMMELIDRFGEQVPEGGTALFYYAGHGLQADGRNYLIPVDADLHSEKEARYKTVDAGLILAKMEAARSRTNLVMLDACRNNPFARSFRALNPGLAAMDAPGGTLLAYATAPGQVASDGTGENSAYTAMLLKHLGTPGLKVEELFKQVRREVQQATHGAQVPWESSSLVGDFYFKPPAPAVSTAVPATTPAAPTVPAAGPVPALPYGAVDPRAVELSYWDSIKDSGNEALLRSYLEQYPQGVFVKIAASKLAELAVKRDPIGKGWLGALLQDITAPLAVEKGLPQSKGALVAGLKQGTPAQKAGLQEGDIITLFDGQTVVQASDLSSLVARTRPDATVAVTVTRDGRSQRVLVIIGSLFREAEQGDADAQDRLGLMYVHGEGIAKDEA